MTSRRTDLFTGPEFPDADKAGPGDRKTVAWWHCFSGIAGDMALGSLIDAGCDIDLVQRELDSLPVGGWEIETEKVLRAGVACTHVHVRAEETALVRTHAHIAGLITEARLHERVRRRALSVFSKLAEAEGRLHNRPPSQVHFHEVGGLDAIVDIVGTCVALEVLGIDELRCSPIALGRGMVRSAHGHLPVPAPAVVELLRGAPTYGTEISKELTTPTGAALVAALAEGFGPLPAMVVHASGFGAGSADIDRTPNAVQVVVGEAAVEASAPGQQALLLEANVDDVTGEVLADAVAGLLDGGAHDAWLTPVVGKKGRPAYLLSAVCDPVIAESLRRLISSTTGTLGVRAQPLTRWPAARGVVEIEVDGYPVRVKVSDHRVKAEHDDAERVAGLVGRPVREVIQQAEAQVLEWGPALSDLRGSGLEDSDGGPGSSDQVLRAQRGPRSQHPAGAGRRGLVDASHSEDGLNGQDDDPA